ncbi:MAG: cyclopropane-fatty-acyl-phospholipid synthase family protein [Sneathiella sp.]|uniref:cyclopropane-fatty-acyl-phospholipid synthase family protein n=1 Tax=Sneathiella sp. TaxID=1964365 RepID=UPI00300102E6
MILLPQMLTRLIKQGTLTVIDCENRVRVYKGEPGPTVTMKLHNHSVARKLAIYPKLYLGEAYMDGSLTVQDGDIYDLLDLFSRNTGWGIKHPLASIGDFIYKLIWLFIRYNPKGRSVQNVAHHYDLSDEFYDLFLDENRQYSCAYFKDADDSLEQAQLQKMAHIEAKLALGDGQKILDIGCGWGGMARFLADRNDVTVKGITLSKNQLSYARTKANEVGLSDKVDYIMKDYRDLTETFDRIVSVGMFEHVGTPHYRHFFKKVKSTLTDDGVALLHTIGTADRPTATNPWIQKYIFPGGYIPPLSEITPEIEKAGLYVTDIEILRVHYADTLRAWRQRFMDKKNVVLEIYDEQFSRMWEFYLAASEVAFRHNGLVVFQIQMAKQLDTLPLTRDYISKTEKEHPFDTQIAAE